VALALAVAAEEVAFDDGVALELEFEAAAAPATARMAMKDFMSSEWESEGAWRGKLASSGMVVGNKEQYLTVGACGSTH
jgi:hypothetical protein